MRGTGKHKPWMHGLLLAAFALPLGFSAHQGAPVSPTAFLPASVWTDKGPDAYVLHDNGVPALPPALPMSHAAAAENCAAPIDICGHSFSPIGVAEGASVTLRVSSGFEGHYTCSRVDGKLSWTQTEAIGSCTSVKVIELPVGSYRRIRRVG